MTFPKDQPITRFCICWESENLFSQKWFSDT